MSAHWCGACASIVDSKWRVCNVSRNLSNVSRNRSDVLRNLSNLSRNPMFYAIYPTFHAICPTFHAINCDKGGEKGFQHVQRACMPTSRAKMYGHLYSYVPTTIHLSRLYIYHLSHLSQLCAHDYTSITTIHLSSTPSITPMCPRLCIYRSYTSIVYANLYLHLYAHLYASTQLYIDVTIRIYVSMHLCTYAPVNLCTYFYMQLWMYV